MRSIHSAPDARIIFFRWKRPDTPVGVAFNPGMVETSAYVVSRDIISLSTSKAKGSPGVWSVTLAPRENYLAALQPGMWAMVFMSDQELGDKDYNHVDSGLKMIGQIRSVRVTEDIGQDGQRRVLFNISGDDFQRILSDKVYINPRLLPAESDKAQDTLKHAYLNEYLTKITSATPDIVVSKLREAFFEFTNGARPIAVEGNRAGGVMAVPKDLAKAVKGPDAVSAYKFVSEGFYPNLIGKLGVIPSMASMQDCWSVLTAYTNPTLNEMYTEMLPKTVGGEVRLMPTIVLRPIPFSEKSPQSKEPAAHLIIAKSPSAKPLSSSPNPYGFYTSKEIGEHEIISFNYGKGDAERFNLFLVHSSWNTQYGLGGEDWSALRNKLIERGKVSAQKNVGGKEEYDYKNETVSEGFGNSGSVVRYGLRPFVQGTFYMTDSDQMVVINDIARDMWGRAWLFDNGQMEIVGSHEYIPVGTNISFPERNWIAHVEAVSHSFSVGSDGSKAFRTNITFVRLQNKTGAPLTHDPNDNVRFASLEMPRGDFDPGISSTKQRGKK